MSGNITGYQGCGFLSCNSGLFYRLFNFPTFPDSERLGIGRIDFQEFIYAPKKIGYKGCMIMEFNQVLAPKP
nr:hypothetical protein [Candidatus Njordarchaeum guaymaensis]